MKLALESTERVVDLKINGVYVPARVWEGETESGIKVAALITRVAVGKGEDQSQFERELREQRPPTLEVDAFPMRMVL